MPRRDPTAAPLSRRRAAMVLSVAVASMLVAWRLAPPSTTGSAAAQVVDRPLTTVSLTWDDARSSQSATIPLHVAHGVRATYFVSSDLIGTSNYYLDRSSLDAVHAAGGEIGGHGDRHVDLTTVPLDTARSLVCSDRDRLRSWYPEAGRSFAYPFGARNTAIEAIVSDCGYASGRGVGGVRTATSCTNCPAAESIPPTDPFGLITVSSVRNTTTLDDLKALVDQGTGGWVIPIFHDLDVAGTYSVSSATYTAFLDWLSNRPDTVVRTVGEVMGSPTTTTTTTSSSTTTSSTTSTSTTTTTPPPSSSLVVNPGLEIDADRNGVPDCWSTNSGTGNRVSWSRTSGHRSTRAEQVVVRRYTSGDVVLLPEPTCVPIVGAGTFDAAVWYRATAGAWFVVQWRDASGRWSDLAESSPVASSRSWTKATRRVELPPGTTAVRFGLALRSTGQLVTDDYALVPS